MDSFVQPVNLLKSISVLAVLGTVLLSESSRVLADEPVSVRQIAIPYYAKGQGSPAAVVRINRIYTDHQRRGFFRIGLLPMLVAEDVRVEVFQPCEALDALQGAKKWLKPASSQALEWRNVRFVFPQETAPRLEANKLRLSEDGAWKLTDGVVVRWGTNETHRSEAILQVTGTRAGELFLAHGGTESLNLLQNPTDTRTR